MEINSDLVDNKDINITTFDYKKDFNTKQIKYENDLKKENYDKFYKNVEYKSQLLNIDSTYRNKIPKNIYITNNDILPNNPIYVTTGSNIIKINYPNHNFNIGDSIIIQQVVSNHKILINSIYFFNKFSYMFIKLNNHGIPLNYNNYFSNYLLSIEIINDIGILTSYGNIPINLVQGIYQIHLPSIIDKTLPLLPEILELFNVQNVVELDSNYILIELPYSFITQENFYYTPSDIFKFTFMNIGGIPLYYINANYPVDYNRYQGYHEIINVESNNIYIQVPISASSNLQSGGNDVQVMLITNTIPGYPNSNSYTINLKKSFNNIVRIELISTEIPYIDFLVKSSGINANNNLYWKHLDDGNHIYNASIPEGNYDTLSLITNLTNALNSVPRYNSTIENPFYNIFTINLNQYTQEIKILSYKDNSLPNSLTANIIEIENIKYIKLTIHHPGNLVEVGDNITITNAIKIGSILDTSYLNTVHKVYDVNITNQIYSVLIGQLNQITNSTTIDLNGNGGPSIVIRTKSKVSFLFNKSNTLGLILGFKDVGQQNAITPYKTQISNFDPYIESTNLNVVGNIDTSISLLNLTGSNFYILMYINNYESIINNSYQSTCFAKILLSGNPGDILFNTFINYPLEFDFPISTLTELNIYFTYPNGTLVDFRNINHSFTLRITEKIIKPKIQDLSYYEKLII